MMNEIPDYDVCLYYSVFVSIYVVQLRFQDISVDALPPTVCQH